VKNHSPHLLRKRIHFGTGSKYKIDTEKDQCASAHEEVPPNHANIQTQQTLPIYTTPPPQPRSATHHRHPITNNLIKGPPPTHTDPSTSNGHPNRSSVFDTPNLEPQTSPASSNITTEPRTEIQGHANVPTPTYLHLHFQRKLPPNVQNPMLDPGNAQHMTTYPSLSFPKHNTPSPQRWKGLHPHHERKPRAHNATHKEYPTKHKGTTTL